jgi:hypothetical protein
LDNYFYFFYKKLCDFKKLSIFAAALEGRETGEELAKNFFKKSKNKCWIRIKSIYLCSPN